MVRGQKDTAIALLGHICIGWGWIEHCVDELIAELAGLEPDLARSLTNNIEIRSKIKTLKALAHIKKPSAEWYDFISDTLDYIDNILRPYRNNFVHAGWFRPEGVSVLRIRKTRIKKPQSFRKAELTTEQEIPVKIREMRSLNRELVGAVRDLVTALSYVIRREPEDALPSISFGQFRHSLVRSVCAQNDYPRRNLVRAKFIIGRRAARTSARSPTLPPG